VYGLTKNIDTYNPIRVATHEYAAIARDLRAAGSWRERAGRMFRGPGWQPVPAPASAAERAASSEKAVPPQEAPLTSPEKPVTEPEPAK
jgi:hypothetical protein